MTTSRDPQSHQAEQPSVMDRIGWVSFAAAGVLAAIAADVLHRTLVGRTSAAAWQGIEPWVPTIVPAHAAYTVAPWPTLIWLALLSTLGFALAAVSILALRNRTVRRSRWVRGLVLWVGVFVVAVGVAGIAQLGEWLLWTESFGGLGGSFLRTFTLPALLEAARWGLIWGLLPAAVGALSDARRPGGRDRRALVVGVALAAVGAVLGAGLAAATHAAALSARTEVAQPEEPVLPVATDPPADIAATAAPDFPGRCSADDVEVTIDGFDAAAGSRYLAFEARNVSAEACDLRGLPDIAFASLDGNAIRPSIASRSDSAGGEPVGGDAVTLQPGGGTARADLIWRAPTGQPSEITVLMAPWAGAERTAATETLDIVDGGEMTLTPWYIED